MPPFRVLFVCWGNICRSPTAEGIMRCLIADAGLDAEVEVDSTGVSSEHLDSPPDRRARKEASRRGLDLRDLRARRVRADDWERFDLLLVTDAMVERSLLSQAPEGAALDKVARIMDFVEGSAGNRGEVPDPYYGGADGFREVYDLLELACAGVLAHAQAQASL
jgi:protein-tyrosine phosphatase